ncbi:MarR family winged helix-turn-helix transcriptional regulator [Neobacillus mesonae]|uniref:MarR family transcriptional regulator n=1 Tax=Neobacillus mesonae TaxID=1193713 RepID=A0A3Q9QVJ2_9BACI|nr:MarR family transcriptional regulator [Neobacillus mesonae]AZU64292.1 MarR family transcriptional regulator [Neobacillus mesonae]
MSSTNHEIFRQFVKLYWNLSRDMNYIWKDIFNRQFPGSQSHILFLLERNGPKKMSEVAELLHLTPGAVTTASDKLIEHGYIARIRDEQDRRVVYLEMTGKGREAITELQEEGRMAMKKVFSHLSDKDLEFLMGTFEQAIQNISDLRKEYDT